MFYMFYDPTMLIVLPGLLLALAAQAWVSGAFARYARVASASGLTGAETAQRILASEGIYDVTIERVRGNLTDHYDPSKKVLRLSDSTYGAASVAAIGVAAHETGHVLQHRDAYAPLMLRTAIVPVVNVGSGLSWPIFLLGLLFSWEPLLTAGIILFSLTVLFSLVTLPVELNASKRARAALEKGGYVNESEMAGVKSVLNAAAMTYVAAALSAILQLLRLLAISGRRNSRD